MAPTSLENTGNVPLPRLGQVLWSWAPCADSLSGQTCVLETCPCWRSSRLQRYLQFYKGVVSTYVDGAPKSSKALNTHEDIFRAVATLKSHPDASRAEFSQLAFPLKDGEPSPNPADLLNATALVVRVLMMIEPSALYHSSSRLEKGTYRVYWKDDIPFSKYLQDLFPIENHSVLSYADSDLFLDMKSELRATKLKKHLGISFRATHDIRNHLHFDRKENVLEIFHHTAFLKEQLRLTKGSEDSSNPSASTRV